MFGQDSKHQYTPVAGDGHVEGELEQQTKPRRHQMVGLGRVIVACGVLVVVALLSFLAGRHQVKREIPAWAESLHRAPVGYIEQKWHYSKDFGAAPESDNVTEAIWDSLIPLGQGFVRHPPEAKHPSAVSVVHQLHCLYSIRRKVFRQDPDGDIVGLNMEHMEPPHLRHCFDYLRQALLCSADSTLEPWNEALGGVTGWGFTRMCRNYDELKEWVEARRTNDRAGFIEVGIKHNHGKKKDHKEKLVDGES